MIVIRSEQNKIFSHHMRRSFDERMLAHIRSCFPKKYHEIGQEALTELIHLGIDRGKNYNIHTQQNIAEFIDLMVVFGPHVDNNAAYPEVEKILDNEDLNGQEKIDKLYGLFNDIPETEA